MEPWEMAVDAISDAVYEAMKRNATFEEVKEILEGRVTTVNALFAGFSEQTTADFDEEVLEVVSTVLRACSDQQWRSKDNTEGDVYSQSIFTTSFLCNITNSAHRLIHKDNYCEGLRTTLGRFCRCALQVNCLGSGSSAHSRRNDPRNDHSTVVSRPKQRHRRDIAEYCAHSISFHHENERKSGTTSLIIF